MRIQRWDVLMVTAAAAASAAVFVACGSMGATADSQQQPAATTGFLLPGLVKPVTLQGCKVSAKPSSAHYAAGSEVKVLITADNPGASPAALEFPLLVERQEMKPSAAMGRVALDFNFDYHKEASETVALTVANGKSADKELTLKLPGGAHVVSTTVDGKKQVLCSFSIELTKEEVVASIKRMETARNPKPAATETAAPAPAPVPTAQSQARAR